MKRILSYLLLATLFVLMLASCTNFDKAEERLVEAGYTVVRAGEGAPEHMVDATDEDVEANLNATAGPNGEWVKVVRFKDKELAKTFYEMQLSSYKDKYFMTVERDGKTVIFGWTEAVKLVK